MDINSIINKFAYLLFCFTVRAEVLKKQFKVFCIARVAGAPCNPITKLNYLCTQLISFSNPTSSASSLSETPYKLIVKLQPFSNKINNSILQGFRLWSQYSLPFSFPCQLCATFPNTLSPFP